MRGASRLNNAAHGFDRNFPEIRTVLILGLGARAVSVLGEARARHAHLLINERANLLKIDGCAPARKTALRRPFSGVRRAGNQ